MEQMIIINVVIVAVLVTAVIVYLALRRQKDAVQDEVNRLTLRLTEMEMKMDAFHAIKNIPGGGRAAADAQGLTAVSKEEKTANVDLSEMDDKELFEQ